MKTLFFLAGLLSLPPAALGQVPARQQTVKDKAYQQAIRRAERYLDSLRTKQDIPGLSVCVGTTQKILWAEGFGYADLEGRQPVTIHSKFRLGSVSKSLTSVAVGRLVEQRKLDLDASVQNYVPAFPVKRYALTPRQLATHTAGIRNYREQDPLACPTRYADVQAGLALFLADSLLFEPGSAYAYSTYGYSLLSAVVEGASHLDYLSYMQQAVFTPLGMTDTSPDYADRIIRHRVRFYEHRQGQVVNAAQVDNSYKWAGGGFLSTPVDLVKLGGGLLGAKVLQPETVALLFTPQLLQDGTNTHYGLGWRVGTDRWGRQVIHHGGLIDGGRTFLLLYPANNLVVAITANMSGVRINLAEAEAIAAPFFAGKP